MKYRITRIEVDGGECWVVARKRWLWWHRIGTVYCRNAAVAFCKNDAEGLRRERVLKKTHEYLTA